MFYDWIIQDGGEDVGTTVEYRTAWYDCIPAAAWDETPITCVHRFEAAAEGPMGNPEVASLQPHYWPDLADYPGGGPWRSPVSDFSKSDRTDPDLCEKSYSVAIRKRLDYYGKYRLDVVPSFLHCTLRTYYREDPRTSVIPPPEIRNCVGPAPGAAVQAFAQMFCERPGWRPDWFGANSRTFTTDDCLDNANGIWKCGPEVNRVPRYDGERADPVGVLDDGKDRRLRWATVDPEGDLRYIEDKETRIQFRAGSPYRIGSLGPASSDQPFVSNPAINDWVGGWGAAGGSGNTDYMVNFQAPGSPNAPWTARAQWRFTAEFLMTKVIINGWFFDPETGRLVPDFSTVEEWVRLPARCNGVPAEIDVNRARNSSH